MGTPQLDLNMQKDLYQEPLPERPRHSSSG
jgi:hypothetical protein